MREWSPLRWPNCAPTVEEGALPCNAAMVEQPSRCKGIGGNPIISISCSTARGRWGYLQEQDWCIRCTCKFKLLQDGRSAQKAVGAADVPPAAKPLNARNRITCSQPYSDHRYCGHCGNHHLRPGRGLSTITRSLSQYVKTTSLHRINSLVGPECKQTPVSCRS